MWVVRVGFVVLAGLVVPMGVGVGRVVLAGSPASAQGSSQAKARPRPRLPPWEETSREDGIVTFKRDLPGSDVIALRGVGTVAAPLVRVVSVLLDYARAPEWIDSLEEVRVVRMLGPREFIEYNRVGTPPIIMKDREFVCHGKLSVDLETKTFVMTIEPAADRAVPPNDDYVRGELHGYWKLKSVDQGKRTLVITEMHGDPRGGVPKWLVNLFQSGWARTTIESLREQVAKPDIQIIPDVRSALEGNQVPLGPKSS